MCPPLSSNQTVLLPIHFHPPPHSFIKSDGFTTPTFVINNSENTTGVTYIVFGGDHCIANSQNGSGNGSRCHFGRFNHVCFGEA